MGFYFIGGVASAFVITAGYLTLKKNVMGM
jgi:hypothetical protein